MKRRAESFLSPSSGQTRGGVLIAVTANPVGCMGPNCEPEFIRVTAASNRQFTVTTKTPLHSTKLPLWKWLQTMYYIVNSSKGISSLVLGRWLGVTQPTAWKPRHCIRAMMAQGSQTATLLKGIVQVDEKYLGGKPRFKPGVTHKRGHGTPKK